MNIKKLKSELKAMQSLDERELWTIFQSEQDKRFVGVDLNDNVKAIIAIAVQAKVEGAKSQHTKSVRIIEQLLKAIEALEKCRTFAQKFLDWERMGTIEKTIVAAHIGELNATFAKLEKEDL